MLHRLISHVAPAALLFLPALAHADDGAPSERVVSSSAEETAALSTPTPLVTPAIALPAMNARVLVGADAQRPSGTFSSIRPEFAGELGLGKGVTVGAGTQWFGGDFGRASDGLSPWAQVRIQLFGDPLSGGWSGGAGLVYKQVGFGGGEREAEASFSATYRSRSIEAGGQAVFGQSARDVGEHDIEARAYGALRVLPTLSLGVAGQARTAVGELEPGSTSRRSDVLVGGIGTAYVGKLQVGVFGGASSLGLATGVGAFGQGFASYRF